MAHQDQEGYQRPLNVIENLQGSSAKLDSAVQALSSSVNTINSIMKDFGRVNKVTKFERKYEIVTEMDFRLAREAIIGKMHRQFNLLFHEAESGLAKLAKQEHDLTLKVEQLQDNIKRLKSGQKQKKPVKRLQRSKARATAPQHDPSLIARREALEKELEELELRVQREAEQLRSAEEALTNHRRNREVAAQARTRAETEAQEQEQPIAAPTLSDQDTQALRKFNALCKLLLPGENFNF